MNPTSKAFLERVSYQLKCAGFKYSEMRLIFKIIKGVMDDPTV